MTLVSTIDRTRPAKARVLVTDGEQRAALAVVRSLGRAGYEVYVQSARIGSLAGASRFSQRELVIAAAHEVPSAFVESIASVVQQHGIGLIIPITDAALQLLLPERDLLAPAVIPFGSAAAHAALSDKRALIERAAEFSIAAPAQCFVKQRRELLATVGASLRFPLVLKPSCSVRMQGGHFCKLNPVYAEDFAALEQHAKRLDDAAFPLLAQERIVGEALGVFLLMWNGRAIARFSHRRLRERPPSGGEMVLSESTALDRKLVERCEALLRAAEWQGPAMVEFKIDHVTGTPYLMEVNARLWGSLQLAIDSGVDFPLLLADAAMGSPVAAPPDYIVGRRLRWFWGDVDHLALKLKYSRQRLNLTEMRGGRIQAFATFAASTLRGEPDAVFRWNDPAPFVREAVAWLRSRGSIVARALRSNLSLRRTPSAAPESVP